MRDFVSYAHTFVNRMVSKMILKDVGEGELDLEEKSNNKKKKKHKQKVRQEEIEWVPNSLNTTDYQALAVHIISDSATVVGWSTGSWKLPNVRKVRNLAYYVQQTIFQWNTDHMGPKTPVDKYIGWLPRWKHADAHNLAQLGKEGNTSLVISCRRTDNVQGLHVIVDGADGGCGVHIWYFNKLSRYEAASMMITSHEIEYMKRCMA